MQYKFVQHTKKQKNLNLHGEKKDTHAAITQMLHLSNKDFFLNLFYLFIIFGCVGSWLLRVGFSLQWLLLLWSPGSRCTGFSSCGAWAQQLWLAGSRAQAQQLWRTGLVAPWHMGSSRTRAQTRVPCIGRQILNHCTTREAL